jgi:hypothetical protein
MASAAVDADAGQVRFDALKIHAATLKLANDADPAKCCLLLRKYTGGDSTLISEVTELSVLQEVGPKYLVPDTDVANRATLSLGAKGVTLPMYQNTATYQVPKEESKVVADYVDRMESNAIYTASTATKGVRMNQNPGAPRVLINGGDTVYIHGDKCPYNPSELQVLMNYGGTKFQAATLAAWDVVTKGTTGISDKRLKTAAVRAVLRLDLQSLDHRTRQALSQDTSFVQVTAMCHD